MRFNIQKDDFKYKSESCKHFENGKCFLGKKCKFAHGVQEKRAYNVFKFFNNFEELKAAPTENLNFYAEKENQNFIANISETEKDLIFNFNCALEKPDTESLNCLNCLNSFSPLKNKNENISETKNSNAYFDIDFDDAYEIDANKENLNSNNNYFNNAGYKNKQKKNKEKNNNNNKIKHIEDKETAHKFQQKAFNHTSKKNNLEILYADPEIASINFKNLNAKFERMNLTKKVKKAENDFKCERELFPTGYVDEKHSGCMMILDDEDSDK